MFKSAIITAGGTIESIDDVRHMEMHEIESSQVAELARHAGITNISKGKLGKEIAKQLVLYGVKTTLMIRKDLLDDSIVESELLKIVTFKSTRDLKFAIEAELSMYKVDLFLMAAAVSDYSPVKFEGKISSDSDEISLKLKKNPKLLDSLRRLAGKDTVIIGFKLLSGVSKESLIEVALKQTIRADLDFTVANDMRVIDFDKGIHPIEVIARDGRVVSLSGSRKVVAGAFVNFLCNHLEN